jgi:nucleoside-diphosphate-sugar epimerase
MHLLLIGATGQIGTALAAAFARTGHAVSVLVRDPKRFAGPDTIRILAFPEFGADAFRTALSGIDHAIYGAGIPDQFLHDATLFDRVNVGLLKSFLDELGKSTVKRLTYLSTFEVFQVQEGVIRESHPIADEDGQSPYDRAMIQAYKHVLEFARSTGRTVTTLHPVAVYGGLDTGFGVTHYLENLVNKRYGRVPFIIKGHFPVIAADSLADATVLSLDRPGAYILSDQMTTLEDMARVLSRHADAYIPFKAPVWMVRLGAWWLERWARWTNATPIMSKIQIDYITKGWEPRIDRAVHDLEWTPMPIDEGIRRYISRRLLPKSRPNSRFPL